MTPEHLDGSETPVSNHIKAGSTAIKIYRNPHRVHLQNGEREYNSFVVSYYRGKKRCRARFNTIEDAETEAQRIQTAILNEDLTALQLTGHDRVSYARALNAGPKVRRLTGYRGS